MTDTLKSLKAYGIGETNTNQKIGKEIVMENNENFVTEVTEKVEQTTEEIAEKPKLFTQDDMDIAVSKAKARTRAKIQKETDRKYGDLIETLRAGTGKEDVEEINGTFRDFYEKKGIDLPKKSQYSKQDIEVLSRADFDEIIRSEEAEEEFERLEKLGTRMNAREQATFKLLAEHLQDTEKSRELEKIGVSKEVYNSQEFKDFSSKFNPNIPIADIYKIYANQLPKKEFKPMGSMKNSNSGDSGVKEYYSPEEAKKFTQSEINNNPALLAAIERSMQKWK